MPPGRAPIPRSNFKLRLVVDKAKAANMPKDNIERAIRRGAGLDKDTILEEITYEGYGPMAWRCSSRSSPTTATGPWPTSGAGSTSWAAAWARAGCVAWQFEPKGYFTLAAR